MHTVTSIGKVQISVEVVQSCADRKGRKVMVVDTVPLPRRKVAVCAFSEALRVHN